MKRPEIPNNFEALSIEKMREVNDQLDQYIIHLREEIIYANWENARIQMEISSIKLKELLS